VATNRKSEVPFSPPEAASSAYDRLPLNALRVFEAVAARLNFGEAAEALHVTPAAVSQQVKALEDYLQTPLFRRTGRNVQLTAEGADLLPGIRRGLDELELALNRLRRDRTSGVVNISTLSSFLQKWLTPRLAGFHSAHPDVELHLHSSRDPVDFSRSDFHAAIRFGAGAYPELYSKKVMDEWLVAVAAPSLLRKHGMLEDSTDLSTLPLLHGSDFPWSSWNAAEGDKRSQRGVFMDDSGNVLVAVLEGLGYAVLRWSLVAGDLAAGHITLASERVIPHRFTYYFVCPESYASLPKVAAVRDWLLETARDFPDPPGLTRPQEASPPAQAARPPPATRGRRTR
jgi:LysR family transcriptional regulator, glycine cleavage system transcriptional activator